MKLVKFSQGNRNGEGVLAGDQIHIVGGWRVGPVDEAPFELSRASPETVSKLLTGSELDVARSEVKLALPIDPRNQIICIGLNYPAHVGEAQGEPPKQPTLFTRHMISLVGPEDALVAPSASESYDFEGEIAVVIGRAGRDVSAADATAHIGAYSCFMDGSVRDFQRHSATAGKNFWRSGSMGPWLVTADELPNMEDAALSTRLNGEEMQSTTAKSMIFDIPAIIAYCSTWTLLQPGDVIATGTPAGVGLFRKPPVWLKAGDTLEINVEGVGTLRNTIIDQ
jgi:2-keto-4-pentenoate hydratase/2-oxohepta-3-ene-1,7-dioic acid hydratase in catechol pathway